MKKLVKENIKKTIKAFLLVLKPLVSKKSLLKPDVARKKLEQFCSMPNGNPIFNNTILEPICDLQIIIPAYNVEQYLEDCVDSILSQKTRYTYRIILIDDGSTDNTGAIADKYHSHENVIVIHQANKGFSGARNTGLTELFGKYIMFVDSDDMLCPGAIDSLLCEAFEHDCDIVEGGAFCLQGEKRTEKFFYPRKEVLDSALGVFHGQPWAKVFKAKCFENIVFPEGFWYEDSILSFLIYPNQYKVSVIDTFTYMYRENPKGITATSRGRAKSVDTYWITEKLLETRADLKMSNDQAFLEKYLRQIRLNQQRMAQLPEYIQESAFVLSVELLRQYFSQNLIEENKNHKLLQILLNNDWGLFKLYCRY